MIRRFSLQRAAAGAVAFAATFAFSPFAHAFCQARACDRATQDCAQDENGCLIAAPGLAWKRGAFTASIDPAGSARLAITAAQTRDVLQRAFDNWQGVECASGKSPALSLQVAELLPGAMNQGEATVTYVDSGWQYPASYGAITWLTFDVDSGEISSAEVEINSETHALAIDAAAPAIDLEAVLTHEVGHLIGLDHTRVPGATMVAETQAFGTQELRSLDADDIAGVCAMYPPRAPASKNEESDSSCAVSSKSSGAQGRVVAACFLAAGLLGAARRRRAKRAAVLSTSSNRAVGESS
ncbi:MAG TPA: matrixin family metalloprotease [Polyangiaceae bacterium]|nr:matrixin family metalloprotease [Polyangiaceae bacterium]